MFQRSILVRFGDCDGLGHVNNVMYFTYMEDARIDIFRLFNPSLELKQWNLIVASTRCDFLKQVSYAETVTVSTWIGRIGTSSFTVEHVITNEAGEHVARGQAVLIAFDYSANRPQELWPDVREQLELHRTGPEGAPPLR